MPAGYARLGDATRRTDQELESSVPAGSLPVCEGRRLSSTSQVLLAVLLFGLFFATLTTPCSGGDLPDATNQGPHLRLVTATRPIGVHAVRGDTQSARLLSQIEQVRFNQQSLSFEQGVTVGPDAGSLEIQFAAPTSNAADSLRYRLLGFDTEWKDAGKDRAVLYNHLAPGRYEFDFQQAESGGARGSVVASIPITVIAPYWQTGWFRTVCIFSLLLLILALYKLRVGFLVRQVHKLQETINQTKAELTLAAKIAGDAQEALKEQALKDSLTGLWNRRAIFAMLEREVCRAQRDHFPITLVMIDLDHFKSINDNYGHPIGDEVLREAAGRLAEVMRPYDFAGRYGGEEFLVVLPSCSPHNGVQRAEEFRRAIATRPVPTALGPLAVTCSIGVASYDEAMPPEDLIHRADEALYRAKHMGRNCVCAANEKQGADRRWRA